MPSIKEPKNDISLANVTRYAILDVYEEIDDWNKYLILIYVGCMYTSFCSSTPSASGDITHRGKYSGIPPSNTYITCVLILKACSRKNIPVYLRLYSIGAD